MKPMAAHNELGSSNLLGIVLTGISFLYARITASDLAAVFTCVLAATNMIIAWPKLKIRLAEIVNRFKIKKKKP